MTTLVQWQYILNMFGTLALIFTSYEVTFYYFVTFEQLTEFACQCADKSGV